MWQVLRTFSKANSFSQVKIDYYLAEAVELEAELKEK